MIITQECKRDDVRYVKLVIEAEKKKPFLFLSFYLLFFYDERSANDAYLFLHLNESEDMHVLQITFERISNEKY